MHNVRKDLEEGRIGKHPNLPELPVFIQDQVKDYHVTEDFDIKRLDPNSKEYKNIKMCDDTRKALKQKIKEIENNTIVLMRKLVSSIGKPNAQLAYFKDPLTPNLYFAVPQDNKMDHYFQKRIIL